jgi:hypothetical protein
LFYHAKKGKWCIAGDRPDCASLYTKNAGELGSGNNLVIKNAQGQPVAFAFRDENNIFIQSLDLSKPFDEKNPRKSVDRKKPQLQILPVIENNADGSVISKLEVRAYNEVKQEVIGRHRHQVSGPIDDEGKIDRPVYRSGMRKDPAAEAKANRAASIVGSDYQGPGHCGYGTLGKFEKSRDAAAPNGTLKN